MSAFPDLSSAWRDLCAQLRTQVGDSVYEVWLAGLQPVDWDGAVLHVSAPPDTCGWIAARFGRLVDQCASTVLADGARVAFTAAHAAVPSSAGPAASYASAPLHGHPRPTRSPPTAAPSGDGADGRAVRLIPRYRFDQFIIGDGNRHAHAAALAVAESPGHAYNPLFLCAPPGLGKTHLLHAIGNYITEFDPSTTVRYTTAEAFTNGFLNALGSRSSTSTSGSGPEALARFKALHRDVDVLLIDDIQFLASKQRTEEEFFHTFNALHDSGRQLVLTCDRLPRQLTGIEDRLRERFEAGLVEHLHPPDHAVRVAILRKRASLDAVRISDSAVFELIAERVTDNVRSLEGALIRIVAHASLTRRPLDVALAADALRDTHPAPAENADITCARIQTAVAHYFSLTADELRSARRTARVAWARQLAIQLAREFTHDSLQRIGEAFGGRNHATILHACKRVAERIATSPDDAADLDALRALLTQT